MAFHNLGADPILNKSDLVSFEFEKDETRMQLNKVFYLIEVGI